MSNILGTEQKGKLYEEYLAEKSKPLSIDIPNGFKLKFSQCWNYVASMKEISFNTMSKIDIVGNKSITIEVVDLMPVANFKYYHITIKR